MYIQVYVDNVYSDCTVPSHKCVRACVCVNVQFYSFSMLLWLYRNIQQLNLFAMTMLHDTVGDA